MARTVLLVRSRLVLAGLVALFLVAGVVEARRDAPTVDEVVDVASGVTALHRLDLRLTPEHGPLPRLAAAVPSLVLDPVVPDGAAYRQNDWFAHTREFVIANEAAGSLTRLVMGARVVTLLHGAAVGVVLWVLGRRWFFDGAGLMAAALWLTTPVVIGFSHVAMIDVPFTLNSLVLVLALDRAVERPSMPAAVLAGAASGGVILTRHSGVALAGAAVVVVAMAHGASARARLRAAATTAVTAWAAVWVLYGLIDPGGHGGLAGGRLSALASHARDAGGGFAAVAMLPWPTTWTAGLGYLHLTGEGRTAYLLGHSWEGRMWWYFPATVLVRSTLPVVFTVLAAPLALRWCPAPARRRVALAGFVPAVALAATLFTQPLNLGIRYALPLVALALVLGAGAACTLLATPGVRRTLAAVALAVQAVTLVAAWPGTIAATTLGPLASEPYRLSADVDLGQDLDRLADRFASGERLYVAVLTPLGRSVEEAIPLTEVEPAEVRGWVAASAAALTTIHRDELSWLRAYCPVDTLGRTVLIYRFVRPPDPRPGPSTPAAPCPDRRESARIG